MARFIADRIQIKKGGYLMKEKWVQINKIQGYENISDCYWISNSDEDKIMNKDTGKLLKSSPNGHGYLSVSLITIDGKKLIKFIFLKLKHSYLDQTP